MRKRRRNKKNAWIHLGGTHHPVAYCGLHRKVLSKNQIRAKQCREKQCCHLKPYRDPFQYAQERAKRSIHARDESSTR